MEWQTINTAPKDGTKILAYWTSNQVGGDGSWGVVHFDRHEEWMEDDNQVGEPTHWTPLPSPPSPEAEIES